MSGNMNNKVSTKVYIPRDTTSLSLGADQVAAAIALAALSHYDEIEIVRNGSRGLFWLEPMVEIETEKGRVAYGPVTKNDVDELVKAGLFTGDQSHALSLGDPEEIPYLKKQQRLTFSRVGVTDPVSVADYQLHGGFAGLQAVLAKSGQEIVDAVKESGLRGRGGAAFPAGIKWQTVHDCSPLRQGPQEADSQKYIVCNADEGDSGTFADRMVMEGDPLMLIEGMTIAGFAVGADQGYIYLRSEYPIAHQVLKEAIANAYEAGFFR